MNQSLRRHIFNRVQFISSVIVILSIMVGVLIIHTLVDAQSARLALTVILVTIVLLVTTSQLIGLYAAVAHYVTPLEHLANAVTECINLLPGADQTSPDQRAQEALRNLRDMVKLDRPGLSHEVRQLYFQFDQILQSLHQSWESHAAHTTLTIMGGVCSQVAHDIRGPLCALKIALREALTHAPTDDHRNLFQAGQDSCTRLNAMANELLEFRRTDTIELAEVDVGALVHSLCAELRAAAADQGVAIRYTGTDVLTARADGHKLGRVVQNLVQNSVQAMRTTPDGSVEVRVESVTDAVQIHIADTGPGIPAQHLDKLFKNQFTTKGSHGNGLGLLYCQQVVQAHGGRITAHNRPAGGACFTIELPNPTQH